MPIIVTSNIATELGGTGYHHLTHPPDYIIVELEHINMNPIHGLPTNHVPIMLKASSFLVSMPGRKKHVTFNRRHFPLVHRFSCTAHKSQGQTLLKSIVDLVPLNGKTEGLGIEFAYVRLLRTKIRRFDHTLPF